MKHIEVETCDPYRDEDGAMQLKIGRGVLEFADGQVRHCDLCTVCGFPTYPECRDWCQNEKLTKGRD